MPGVGGLPMPAISSDDEAACPFPSRSAQLGTIGALRLRVGLRADALLDLRSGTLPVSRARKRRVRRGRLGDSEDQQSGSVAGVGSDIIDGGPGGAGLGGPSDSEADAGTSDGRDGAALAGTHNQQARNAPPKRRKVPLRLGTPRANAKSRAGGTLAERLAAVHDETRASVLIVIRACLRMALGLSTRTADFCQPGVSGRLVGAASSPSRAVVCRFGPALIDVAALWCTPTGQVMCFCAGHNQNVTLAAITGAEIKCWHADCFREVLTDLDADEVKHALHVSDATQPHAITFDLKGIRCGLAFDGDIFSPVVAVERRQIKCIGVGCRSMQRSCTHATLVRALPEFSSADVGGAVNESEEDQVSVDDGMRPPTKASADFGEYGQSDADVSELRACVKGRRKRNLLPCMQEDKQGARWLRTADMMTIFASGVDRWSSLSTAVPQFSEPPAPLHTLINDGLLFNTKEVLVEQKCTACSSEM